MTNEEQKELLSDLCSRLPYGVKVQIDLQSNIYQPMICKVCNIEFAEKGGSFIGVEVSPGSYSEYREFLCKPYLFPMSSMTEEQRKEYEDAITYHGYIDGGWAMVKDFANEYVVPYWFVDFCNKNHLDYRGWINVGLAIDATGKNIY